MGNSRSHRTTEPPLVWDGSERHPNAEYAAPIMDDEQWLEILKHAELPDEARDDINCLISYYSSDLFDSKDYVSFSEARKIVNRIQRNITHLQEIIAQLTKALDEAPHCLPVMDMIGDNYSQWSKIAKILQTIEITPAVHSANEIVVRTAPKPHKRFMERLDNILGRYGYEATTSKKRIKSISYAELVDLIYNIANKVIERDNTAIVNARPDVAERLGRPEKKYTQTPKTLVREHLTSKNKRARN